MKIILETTPTVYQWPQTGLPDQGLEVYIWENGDIDVYLNGKGILFSHNSFGELDFHLSPRVFFDLSTKTFKIKE